MKKIPLTQKQYALVDDADYDSLRRYKWYAKRDPYTFYAVRTITINGNEYRLFMHRLILGLTFGDGKQTDHIDGDGLNNRRANLRICSHAENHHNQRVSRGYSSIYKGVCWHKRDRRWRAQIKLDGRRKYLGSFKSESRAALVYNRAAKEHFGEYARLNKVRTGECSPVLNER